MRSDHPRTLGRSISGEHPAPVKLDEAAQAVPPAPPEAGAADSSQLEPAANVRLDVDDVGPDETVQVAGDASVDDVSEQPVEANLVSEQPVEATQTAPQNPAPPVRSQTDELRLVLDLGDELALLDDALAKHGVPEDGNG